MTRLRNTGIIKNEIISTNTIISYIRRKIKNTQNSLIPNDFTIFYCYLYFLGYLHLYSKSYVTGSYCTSPVSSVFSHAGCWKLAGWGGRIYTMGVSKCCRSGLPTTSES